MIVWGELKWSMLVEDACKPKHLLWAIIFLKTYTTESSLAVAIGVDEKTLLKWIFIFIYVISDLEDDWVGSLCSEDSFDISNNSFSTDKMGEQVSWILWWIVPGDCGWDRLLDMLKPSTKDFYSHKFAKAGLCYEVGVCIQTGLIVWISGPFAAGKYNNITIFQLKMIYELLDWEMVEADQGYVGQDLCEI